MLLFAKHGELTDARNRVKSQHAVGAPVSNDLEPGEGVVFERPAKFDKMTFQSKESSSTSSTATFFALLTAKGDFQSRCEMIALQNHSIFELAVEAEEWQKKLADC